MNEQSTAEEVAAGLVARVIDVRRVVVAAELKPNPSLMESVIGNPDVLFALADLLEEIGDEIVDKHVMADISPLEAVAS